MCSWVQCTAKGKHKSEFCFDCGLKNRYPEGKVNVWQDRSPESLAYRRNYSRQYLNANRQKRNAHRKQWRHRKNLERLIIETLNEILRRGPNDDEFSAAELKKSQIRQRRAEYRRKHRAQIKRYKNDYHKRRVASDALYAMKSVIRTRIGTAFRNARKGNGWTKQSTTSIIIGADWGTVKQWIESQFKKGMSWSNHGEWHIDHAIPVCAARTEAELHKLCHYTNLQPPWKHENLSKKGKIGWFPNETRTGRLF